MTFFKSKTNIIFSIITVVLAVAVAFLGFTVWQQKTRYVQASTSLTDNEAQLAEAESRIAEITDQLEEYEQKSEADEAEKNRLNSELQSAIAEKDRLSKENAALKGEIEKLRAERREQLKQEIALNNVVQASAAESGICYLTFDDGPSDNTLAVMDILDSYGIKGTFFVVSTSKNSYLPQICNRGHAIGLHSATHSYSQIYSSVDAYLADLKLISDIVYSHTGIRSNIMRFPGGSSNKVSASYCQGIMTELTALMPTLGYSYYDWNVSSGDASGHNVPASTIVSNVLNGAQGKNSICVLMHDTSAKGTTVQALPYIIEGLHAMGFRFAPLTADVYGFHQTVIN